jgi:cellulose biosynthesis protein BcsQ
MIVLAVYNLKGGVGKTTTAVNLAYLAAREGLTTLLWDLDPQGAASFYLDTEPEIAGDAEALLRRKNRLHRHARETPYPRLDLIPADFSYRHLDLALDGTGKPARRIARLLQPLSLAYDWVILDAPPGISRLADSLFVAADALLIPTIPTPLSLRSLEQVRGHLETLKSSRRPRVLPFFSMADRRKGLHRAILETAGDEGFLTSRLSYLADVERMGTEQAPLPAFAPWRPAAREVEALWREVRAALG